MIRPLHGAQNIKLIFGNRRDVGACSAHFTHWPGIEVPLGSSHSFRGESKVHEPITINGYNTLVKVKRDPVVSYLQGCQTDTFCVIMTQFDVAWHNDTFGRNDDIIDANDIFFDKKWHNQRKWHIFQKKYDTILSSKSCFLNGNKRKVKF